MSSTLDGTKIEGDAIGNTDLPAKPIPGRLAIWGPRIATLGYLGLSLWRAQHIPGPHGAAGVAFPFFGTSPHDRSAARHMTLTLASPLMIWTIEGYREVNSMTPLALPVAFGVASQVFGIARVAPLYYACSLFSADATGASRNVDPLTAMAAFPATMIGHVLPSVLMNTLPLTATEVSRSYFTLQSVVCYAFYFSPITVSLLTKGIAVGVKWLRRTWNSSSTPADKQTTKAPDAQLSADLPALQRSYYMMLAFQTAQHLLFAAEALRMLLKALAPFSLHDQIALLVSARSGFASSFLEVEQGPAHAIGSSLTLFMSSTLAFLLHTVWDLRRHGYITTGEAVKACLGLSATPFAPGAAYTGFWSWRESILSRVAHS